jgi:ribosomal protein S18 acetylase RimI-like enzyme
MSYTIEYRLPDVDEYLSLRNSVGWPLFDPEVVRAGLTKSLFGVCIRDGCKIIGAGRILGDGAIYFHIQDVIVDPAYQRSGIGKMLMNALMQYIGEHAGANANIGLMCSKGREKFYEGFGFTARPADKYGAGMIKVVEQ